MINNIEELASEVGADENIKSISRRVYKGTACGAWCSPLGDEAAPSGVVVGSIVEGVDHGTQCHELPFPFKAEEFWKALQEVEDEAGEIWNETHGCEDCGPDNEYGYRSINPNCTTCEGGGAII